MEKMNPISVDANDSDARLKASALALIRFHKCIRTSALAGFLGIAPRKAGQLAAQLCDDGSVVACTIRRPGCPDEQELRPAGSPPRGRMAVQIERQRAKGRKTQIARARGVPA